MFGLGHIGSNVLYPYQVVFLLLGSVTFLVGLLSYVLLLSDFQNAFPQNKYWQLHSLP
jgi:hypothetical protein